MIFSELYSAYYNTVARILARLLEGCLLYTSLSARKPGLCGGNFPCFLQCGADDAELFINREPQLIDRCSQALQQTGFSRRVICVQLCISASACDFQCGDTVGKFTAEIFRHIYFQNILFSVPVVCIGNKSMCAAG